MSWEPDSPCGFSPCGVAFGALRKAYSAPCKFHADEVAGDNRINWYRVPDDRQVYEGLHVFHPRVDTDAITVGGRFEKEGPGRFVRQFEPGFDIYGFPGTHIDGDEQDFLGKSPLSKHFIDGELISPLACVGIGTNPAGIRLGATIGEGPYHADLALGAEEFFAPFYSSNPAQSGRMFKGVSVTKTPVDFANHHAFFPIVEGQKYRLDFLFEKGVSWAWALGVGDTYGTADFIATENPETRHRVYFEFEAIADGFAFVSVAQLGETFGEFRAVYWDEPFPPEIYDAEFRVGAVVADPPYPFGSESAGLALGAVEASGDSDYTLAAGLTLGAVEADGAPPVVPGGSCTDAGELVKDVAYEFDIGPGEHQWLKVPGNLGPNAIVNVAIVSGSLDYVTRWYGSTCASKSYATDVFDFPNGIVFYDGEGDWQWFEVVAPLLGGSNTYSIEWNDF